MDFFENLKEVVSETAHTVAKKSEELIDKSKTTYAIFDLNNDVKKLYNEIGRLTYLSIEEDEDHTDSIKMKCDIIKSKLARIDSLRTNTEFSGFKCPVCGKPSDNSVDYCPSCGANMTVDVECDVKNVEE